MERRSKRLERDNRELAILAQLESDEVFKKAVETLTQESDDWDDELAEVFAALAEKYGASVGIMQTALEIAKLRQNEPEE